jgi:hypothetical protein
MPNMAWNMCVHLNLYWPALGLSVTST